MNVKTGIPEGSIKKALVVCTGPSVKGMDWTVLKTLDATIFAVNYALYHIPCADYWYSFDKSIIESIEFRLPCVYVAALSRRHDTGISAMQRYPCGSHHVQRLNLKDVDKPGFLFDGRLPGDSGFSCINLAVLMGAKKIAVAGFDCTYRSHLYDNENNGPVRGAAKRAAGTVDQCRELGVEIVNGSPGSRCGAWPIVDPSAAIKWLEEQK